MIRFLFWSLFLVVALAIAVPATVILVAIEPTPAIADNATVASDDAAAVKALAARYRRGLGASGPVASLIATQRELDGAVAFAVRALPGARGRVVLSPRGVTALATLRLPRTPLGEFVNFRAEIAASDKGLVVRRVAIGDVEIPGKLVVAASGLLLDLALGAGEGAAVLDAVQGVAVTGKRVTLRYRPIPDLAARLAERARAFANVAEPALVRVYYRRLIEVGRKPGLFALGQYMKPLFALAAERSKASDPVAENRALIMALAMTLGDSRFERMIGEVRTGALKNRKPRFGRVLLGGRRDFLQHFVISAGLTLVSDVGVSNVIGEFKEIQDSLRGGSGFSFNDLAADRAGVALATAAADPRSARRLQALLGVRADQGLFFPRVDDLPEGLSKAEFKRRYGSIDGAPYKAMIEKIDGRISRLPAYAEG